ncbi:MAG: mechanosensitive ion channel family protein [Betaproteobacteria bacterium]
MISYLLRVNCYGIRTTFAIWMLPLGLMAAVPAIAQDEAAPAVTIERAPVVVDGEVLFQVRGISSYPAKHRADAVSERIRAIARDESVHVSELRVVEARERSDILAGERQIISLFDGDAEVEQLGQRQQLAEFYRAGLMKAIERYRHERSGAYLRTQGIHAALVLGLLVALLVALKWVFRRLDRAVERRMQARLRELEAKSYRLLSAEQIRNTWHSGLRTIHFVIGFVLALACLNYALSLFAWTRPIARRGADLLLDPLSTMWGGLIEALPGLIFIAILIVITRYILKLIQLFFGGIAHGSIKPAGFEQEWAWPTYRLVRIAIVGFALVMAYPYIPGSDSEAFKGVSIFFGLLMSIGAASMVANNLAGYTLIYRRAFKVGDRIKVGDVIGDVVAMRQQVTQLRTVKNEEVIIPSSLILNSHVVNYSSLARDKGLILHTTVGIGYETPWRQVEAMLIEAAKRTDDLLREPPPFVLQQGLGDFSVTYEINVYCDRPQEMAKLYTALHRNILDVFNEHGVQIMTPAYEGDPEQPKVVPKDQWYPAPAQAPRDR